MDDRSAQFASIFKYMYDDTFLTLFIFIFHLFHIYSGHVDWYRCNCEFKLYTIKVDFPLQLQSKLFWDNYNHNRIATISLPGFTGHSITAVEFFGIWATINYQRDLSIFNPCLCYYAHCFVSIIRKHGPTQNL